MNNNNLEQASQLAIAALRNFAQESHFWQGFELAFGVDYDRARAENIRQEAIDGNLMLPIRVLDDASMGVAVGAFAAATNTIYLRDSFVQAGDLRAIGAVIVEELGHSIDSRVNKEEAPGDEGAIFRLLVGGGTISADLLAELKVEDDWGLIVVDGQELLVEMATIIGTSGNDNLPRLTDPDTSGDDSIFGLAGDDLLDGGMGNDSLYGDAGDDTLSGGQGDDYLQDNIGNNILNGGDGNDTLVGGIDSILNGGNGDDFIVANIGNSTLNGGDGVDTLQLFSYSSNASIILNAVIGGYTVDGTTIENLESFTFIGGNGNDYVDVSVTNYSNDLSGGNGDDTLIGGTGEDYLYGEAGDDILNGELGSNYLEGGVGNDTYIVNSIDDVVLELLNEGVDIIQSSISYILGGNIEDLTLVGTASNGTGNFLDNKIKGNTADNDLSGGLGNDGIEGGDGADTIHGGSGDDAKRSSFTLGGLTGGLFGGNGDDVIHGDDGRDYLSGDDGNDILYGGDGDDADFYINGSDSPNPAGLFGGNGSDVIYGNNGRDYLSGGENNDILEGGSGDDTLDGGTGEDSLVGGAGDDFYIIDATGDTISELFNEGTDIIESSVSYTLGNNIEKLTLANLESALNGIGNNLANSINGNNFNNLLVGGAGNDTLRGSYGIDSLNGGDGDDYLDGEGDNDVLNGGAGNDYLSDGAGDDLLDGGDGNDTLNAGNGNDILNGGTGNDSLTGGSGNDTFVGFDVNKINPGLGELDSLNGGTGSDRFILGDKANIYYDDQDTSTTGNTDYALIADFNPNEDKIQLQGTASNYLLQVVGLDTKLYIDKVGSEPDELIGILSNVIGLNLTSSAFQYVASKPVRNDFNDDQRADILWRNTITGEMYNYQLNGLTIAAEGSVRTVSLDWEIAGTGDFNGDNKSDILWRNSISGETYIYQMNGSIVANEGSVRTVSLDWKIAGTGDFNGDSKSDVVWRNQTTGEVYIYQMNGSIVANEGSVRTVSLDWKIAGTGDFNGDSKSDILWRNSISGETYIYQMNGLSVASEQTVRNVSNDWVIEGVDDFNNDGKSDILWRNSNSGNVYGYLMNGAAVTSEGSIGQFPIAAGWEIAGTGDNNGDGNGDILWRNANGAVSSWQLNGLTKLAEGSIRQVSNDWQIASPTI
jgi:Ca2+-binding RTX toxin-like protein